MHCWRACRQCWPNVGSRVHQVLGRCFQLRDGSGSGIGTVFLINRVLSGNENLDRVFSVMTSL